LGATLGGATPCLRVNGPFVPFPACLNCATHLAVNFRTKLSVRASAAEVRFRVDGGNRLQNRLSVVCPMTFSLGIRREKPALNRTTRRN
jgi:hypothetical protein